MNDATNRFVNVNRSSKAVTNDMNKQSRNAAVFHPNKSYKIPPSKKQQTIS